MNRRGSILALLSLVVAQSADGQTTSDPVTINLDDTPGLDVWYKGQLVVISSAEIFAALEPRPKPRSKTIPPPQASIPER